jgi:hypothetical protein
MAAGLGFKDFVTGEVLTAADVDGYLMQGVWVFASAAARDAAVTSPQEGNFAYLKDTNVTTYYTGSAWANLDTTGMTNPMTTTGDTIYSSSGSTPARLGIGSTGNVLTVAGGVPTWAAPAGGSSGLTLIKRASFSSVSNTGTTFDDMFSTTYKSYMVVLEYVHSATAGDDLQLQMRYAGPTTTTADYTGASGFADYTSASGVTASNVVSAFILTANTGTSQQAAVAGTLFFTNVGNTNTRPRWHGTLFDPQAYAANFTGGLTLESQLFTGFLLKSSNQPITGVVAVYGLAA